MSFWGKPGSKREFGEGLEKVINELDEDPNNEEDNGGCLPELLKRIYKRNNDLVGKTEEEINENQEG